MIIHHIKVNDIGTRLQYMFNFCPRRAKSDKIEGAIKKSFMARIL